MKAAIFTAVLFCAKLCYGQSGDIKVSYRLINSVTTPESFALPEDGNIGVMVFLKVSDSDTGKVDVQIGYIDAVTLTPKVVSKTISREATHAGYQPFPLAVFFAVPIKTVTGIIAYGFKGSGVVTTIP